MKCFKIGSLFDGSGGFPLAATMCGGEAVWASEVEPYPIAVTRSRFPKMKHLGSVTEINGAKVDPVDCISFGSPCQDLSVAGLRKGLKHEDNGDEETTRSGLFMEAVRIIKEMREATNGIYPTFAVWENVPGAFSSNKGEDFRTVLEELIKIAEPTAVMPTVPQNGWAYADSYCGDGWSIAYRVFDAQYWGKTIRDGDSGSVLVRGTPQRRRRIYLVADFRGQRARKVLFERKGLRRNSETSREEGEETAGDAESCPRTADSKRECVNPAYCLQGSMIGRSDKNGPQGDGVNEEVSFTCNTIDRHAVAYGISSFHSNAMLSDNPDSGIYEATTSRTLDLNGGNPACNQGGIMVVEPVVAVDQGGGKSGANFHEDLSPTLTCTHGGESAVAYTLKIRGGVDVDSKGKAAGKGALIQKDLSATLGVSQDQYLFQPVEQYLFENHSQDSRYRGPLDVCPMLPAQLGTGGNNQPFVVKRVPADGEE